MTVKYPLHAKRECLVSRGAYYELPEAIAAHRKAIGDQPRSLAPTESHPAARCTSCGGPIDPHSGECRCSA